MPKTKLSITLESGLVEQVQALTGAPNRSESIERALRSWLARAAHDRLDAETERYYRGMDASEAEEDAAWTRLGDEALAATE